MLDELQPVIDIQAIDEDVWRRRRIYAFPVFEDAAVVIDCRFGPEAADDAERRHALKLARGGEFAYRAIFLSMVVTPEVRGSGGSTSRLDISSMCGGIVDNATAHRTRSAPD